MGRKINGERERERELECGWLDASGGIIYQTIKNKLNKNK